MMMIVVDMVIYIYIYIYTLVVFLLACVDAMTISFAYEVSCSSVSSCGMSDVYM